MLNEKIGAIFNNISAVIMGRDEQVLNIIKGVLAGGHILINDVPGVGKTTLIKSLCKSIDLKCNRIQFTPDLLPTDILGVSIYNKTLENFEFKKGPIFCNMILADEINRASPKTQSALLQAMEEKCVSEGDFTYNLQEPFIVMATENPIDEEGTYSLPEAQKDRFMISCKIGYPSPKNEVKILYKYRTENPIDDINAVISGRDLMEMQREVRNVNVDSKVLSYIVYIVNATRGNPYLRGGVSVRASMALMRVAQATAYINGRNYVIPDDVKDNIDLVIKHRLILNVKAYNDKVTPEIIIQDIINKVTPRV
ncbi:MoxR-like ATPase [Hathewaya proteolytica DSM 3090]|uniref:MoxR-like ATPase n=1 Tax=Hathewaya proteolytica DSM 3090 TaxID=1121331 RepID=A0A1M6T7D4_9CLOT|nr:MoxR family ATPase [Hathewaya proteolytica]SHK52863.1 MoxR-like ATPase [Hathewaya proteolytica DSM 3090]